VILRDVEKLNNLKEKSSCLFFCIWGQRLTPFVW
jgi:hypothetical protein